MPAGTAAATEFQPGTRIEQNAASRIVLGLLVSAATPATSQPGSYGKAMTAPTPVNCQVWWGKPTQVQTWHWELLNRTELQRAGAYRQPVDQQRFVWGVAMSRLLVAFRYGLSAIEVVISRTCADCSRPHGKPQIVGYDIHYSISHAGDAVGIAITEAGPVGLDIEKIDNSISVPENMVLTDFERCVLNELPAAQRTEALLRYWVRKEAVLKATGEGLRRPMTTVEISSPTAPARLLGGSEGPQIKLSDINAPADHVAALAGVFNEGYLGISEHDAAQLMKNGNY